MTKRAKTLSALLTALSVMTLSACSSEEPVNIDPAITQDKTETEAAVSTQEPVVTTSEKIDETVENISEETQPPQTTIPTDKRIPYDGIELDISDAVEVNESGDAIFDFSYLRYSSDFYVDSNNHDMSNFTVPPLEDIEYIKVEKGQEISGGLKVKSAKMWLASYPDYISGKNSEIASSDIDLEGSVTWEGLLWFYGDDEPIIGDLVLFAPDPSKNSEIPIGIESKASMSFYSNDDFRFVMDSNSFFIDSIKEMDADVESALRENGCIRIRATFTNICLSCSTRASGYNHSHADMSDVEILK